MTAIPSELYIDEVPWRIAICDTLPEDESGETMKREARILLAADLQKEFKASTFWHELIHAIFTTRDVKLTPTNADDLEEQVATLLGPALHSFFIRNAEIKWIYGSLE